MSRYHNISPNFPALATHRPAAPGNGDWPAHTAGRRGSGLPPGGPRFTNQYCRGPISTSAGGLPGGPSTELQAVMAGHRHRRTTRAKWPQWRDIGTGGPHGPNGRNGGTSAAAGHTGQMAAMAGHRPQRATRAK